MRCRENSHLCYYAALIASSILARASLPHGQLRLPCKVSMCVLDIECI
jgi:hypothetical protein